MWHIFRINWPAAWVGGCLCVCLQVCCRLLSRPDNADSGSIISWTQTSVCVSILVSGSVSGDPGLLSALRLFLSLVCCVSRRMRVRGRHVHAHRQTNQTP